MATRTIPGVPPAPATYPLAMVYGGGGPFGIAFGAGVAKGLEAAGIPVSTAPALGTSAGSWVASIMVTGMEFADFDLIDTPRVPDRTEGLVVGLAREAFGDSRSPLVSAAAVRVSGGKLGRTILHGDDYDLADICAASSSAPYLLPRHTIDGATYLDGGVRSSTSIELAADAEHVIVVAPLARGVQGRAGRLMQWQLDHEIKRWQRAHRGRRITLITPDVDSACFAGDGPKGLFDPVNSRLCYEPAVVEGTRWGEALIAQAERAEAGLSAQVPAFDAVG